MTYLGFSLVFVVLATVPALLARRHRSSYRWREVVLTAVVLGVLTAVFDSVMVAYDLFRYDEPRTLGVDMPVAPVEDLTWAVAAALLLPALWVLLDRGQVTRRRSRRRPRRGRAGRVR